jgi:hypothetical protein
MSLSHMEFIARRSGELQFSHCNRASAEPNEAILPRFGRVAFNAIDFRFADPKRPMAHVEVLDGERYLLGGAHPGEEAKLIVVALRLAPVLVDCGDQDLGILDSEWRRGTCC